MKKAKKFAIEKTHRGRRHTVVGTVEELTDYFGYTLECGHSWNNKINIRPKTIKSLITALNKSVHETQGNCYDQDYYDLGSMDAEDVYIINE